MAKYYGTDGFRIGKVGNERYYLRNSANLVAVAKPYKAINSQWIKQEEFKQYVLSLLDVDVPQVYLLDELPEQIYPYALIFVQNDNATSIYFDKQGVRTQLHIQGGGGGGFEPTQAQLAAMNSGINADKEASFEQNLIDTGRINARVTTAEGDIETLNSGKLDKRTEGFEVYSHEDAAQGALLVKQSTSGVLADASLLTEKAVTDELKKKLSLTGGTMTGTITTQVNIALKRQLDDSELDIYAGTALNKGASLAMHGKDRPYDPGAFKLYATDGTNTKELKGKPDGSLTWDGVDILKPAHYIGDSVMTISNISSQGLFNGADYASNVTRRITKVGRMVYFTCHIKWKSTAVGIAWTTVGTIASAFRPSFNRPTIVGMVYNNGTNEACGGNVDTSGVIQVLTNAKTTGDNYQIRLSAFWTVA